MRPPHSNPFYSGLGGGRRTVGKPRNALAEGPGNNPQTALGQSASMFRPDGSMKGSGYLGPIKNSQGQTMTEYSIGVEFDGKEMDIPTFVPTLSPQEIQYLTNMQEGMPIPESIQKKAIDHALERMRAGQNPFANSGPSHARRR